MEDHLNALSLPLPRVMALDMIESATHKEPTSWRYAMTKATLAYDHMQFRRQRDQDAASYNASREELFRAFGEAAKQYQAAVIHGELREDPGVYLTWFNISLGSSDLSTLTANDLLTEGSENTEQIQKIRRQILEMPDEMADSHFGEFARRIIDKLPSLTPEVKPGVVRRASDIVGEHPAGALLRQTLDMYDDLLRNEIHLHLAIDGSDQLAHENLEPFLQCAPRLPSAANWAALVSFCKTMSKAISEANTSRSTFAIAYKNRSNRLSMKISN